MSWEKEEYGDTKVKWWHSDGVHMVEAYLTGPGTWEVRLVEDDEASQVVRKEEIEGLTGQQRIMSDYTSAKDKALRKASSFRGYIEKRMEELEQG